MLWTWPRLQVALHLSYHQQRRGLLDFGSGKGETVSNPKARHAYIGLTSLENNIHKCGVWS